MKQANTQVDMSEAIKKIIDGMNTAKKTKGKREVYVHAESRAGEFIRNFRTKPSELIKILKKKVIKQDEAIRVLCAKVCGHYNAIRNRLEKGENPMDDVGRIKSNILLVGDTGVGKTFILALIAKALDVPFIKADATDFTEAGYVGKDVDDIVRDLAEKVKNDDGFIDVEMAQYGIVFIDEIDKIAAAERNVGHDVSRTGVQRALLTLIEDKDVALKPKMDPIEHMKIIKMLNEGKEIPEYKKINTRNILFIFSGAFPGLADVIEKRMNVSSIGFESPMKDKLSKENCLDNLEADDFVRFGLESEFVGRIPIRVRLESLNEEDLYQIISRDSPVIKKFVEEMASYGIEVTFEDEVYRYIAKIAAKENKGARGLMSAFHKVVGPYEVDLPDIPITELNFSLPLVDGTYDPAEFIKQLGEEVNETIQKAQKELQEKIKEESKTEIVAFIKTVYEKHKLVLIFDNNAENLIAHWAETEKVSQRVICETIFSKCELAFNALVKTGTNSLVVTKQCLNDPINYIFDILEKE